MSEKEKETERILDLAVEAIRSEEMSSARVSESAERTRIQLGLPESGHVPIRGCADFQDLIPEYLNDALPAARKLLFEDHVRECVACRKALTAARTSDVERRRPERVFRPSPWLRWGAVAAGVALVAAVLQLAIWSGFIPGLSGPVAALADSRGEVFSLSRDVLQPMTKGNEIVAREMVRTGKDSGALLTLQDGSRVELAERTELSLENGWRGTTIRLQRGHVIVEAADQGSGHLYVATGDCLVAVKGTVFSVNHGIKGSRVAVIEGEVWVEKGKENTVLMPGQQYVSRPGLGTVALQQEFGWSENASEHLALLSELAQLNHNLQQASFGEQLRYESELAGRLPAGTAVYGAFPNISDRLKGVYDEFRNRIESSPVLDKWRAENPDADLNMAKMDELVEKLAALGGTLGPEVVVAVVAADEASPMQPVLLTQAVDPASFEEMLVADLQAIAAEKGEQIPIQVVRDVATVPADYKGLVVLVDANLVIASPSLDLIRGIASGTAAGFVDSRFYQTVSASYANGVDWLFAVDLERMASKAKSEAAPEDGHPNPLEFLGLDQAQDLVIERKQVQGIPDNRAVMTYSGEPHGLLSWTASPGPMGGLDYVSANANFVAAFVVRDPAELLDEVLAMTSKYDPEALDELARFEAEHGLSIRQNVAAPLGGEAIFALDGPVLPTPSWKIIVEVYQPDVLQQTIEHAISEINQAAAADSEAPGISIVQSTLNGNPLYQISAGETGPSVYYQYTGGYLIAVPDPALITQALQYRSSGVSLSASAQFAALLPQDSSLNLSAFVYQNISSLVEPLLSSGITQSIAGAENQEALQKLLGNTPPLMATLYSEPGRVTLASTGDMESLWSNFSALASLGGPEGIVRALSGGSVQ